MRLSKLLVALSLVVAIFMLSAGVASAEHSKGAFVDCEVREDGPTCAPHWAPVGQNLVADPDFPGRDGLPGGAIAGITHNPNCPLHWELGAPM